AGEMDPVGRRRALGVQPDGVQAAVGRPREGRGDRNTIRGCVVRYLTLLPGGAPVCAAPHDEVQPVELVIGNDDPHLTRIPGGNVIVGAVVTSIEGDD